MIDHVGFGVTDFEEAKAFFDKALSPIGASLLMMVPEAITGGEKVGGYGIDNPVFWLHEGEPCLLYTSPSPRDKRQSRMPSSA